jgi:hypothetical protein
MPSQPHEHPVRLRVEDDLRRSRLTVFFRILLAIPHLLWATLFSIVAALAAIPTYLAALAVGRPPASLHRFLSAYIRYLTHLNAYIWLVGNPYPGFSGGEDDRYPVDVELPGPAVQARWRTLLRLPLVLPALLLATAFGSVGEFRTYTGGSARTAFSGGYGGGLIDVAAFLAWFAALARGRMPKGLRDAGAYSVGYTAQVLAYLLLVTDRYPDSDPTAMLASVERPPVHPVHLEGDADELRRSRLTVFFRLPLAIPHLVWLLLWGVVAFLVSVLQWLVTLLVGRPWRPLHRFLSRYVRYQLHVGAFLFLAANPFPGFTGVPGSYPLDLVLPTCERQNRWKTAFRALLAVPAWILGGALSWGLVLAAFLTWFVAIARGRASYGMRNVSAYALRYSAQLYAYLLFLTDAYPHASPLEGAAAQEEEIAGLA